MAQEVYVVMGNDYPAEVFDNEAAAERYCDKQRAAHRKGARVIYWRVYSFPLVSDESDLPIKYPGA